MWNQKEVRREPLPDGTVLCTENGRFTIQKYITSGGFALLYQAQEEGQMYPVILKEYFPRQGYVRVDGAVLPEEAAALPENDPEREKRIETMRTLLKSGPTARSASGSRAASAPGSRCRWTESFRYGRSSCREKTPARRRTAAFWKWSALPSGRASG